MLNGYMEILNKIGGMEVSGGIHVRFVDNCISIILKEGQSVAEFYESGRPLYGYQYYNGSFCKVKITTTNPNVVSDYEYKSVRIRPITPNPEEEAFIDPKVLERFYYARYDKTLVYEPSIEEQENFDFKDTEEYLYHLESLTWYK